MTDDDQLEARLASMTYDDLALEHPSDEVWAGIADETGQGQSSADSRRWPILVGAAAAVLVVAIVASLITGDESNDPVEVAVADLVHSPEFAPEGADATAAATLLDDNGTHWIRFDRADLPTPAAGENVELWLFGLDSTGEVALIRWIAVVADLDEPGAFQVPADLSIAAYPNWVVDISFELEDGVADHSGRSILRGTLVAT